MASKPTVLRVPLFGVWGQTSSRWEIFVIFFIENSYFKAIRSFLEPFERSKYFKDRKLLARIKLPSPLPYLQMTSKPRLKCLHLYFGLEFVGNLAKGG